MFSKQKAKSSAMKKTQKTLKNKKHKKHVFETFIQNIKNIFPSMVVISHTGQLSLLPSAGWEIK